MFFCINFLVLLLFGFVVVVVVVVVVNIGNDIGNWILGVVLPRQKIKSTRAV